MKEKKTIKTNLPRYKIKAALNMIDKTTKTSSPYVLHAKRNGMINKTVIIESMNRIFDGL